VAVYRIIPEQTTLQTELLIQNLDVYVSVRPDEAQRIIDVVTAVLPNTR